MKLNTILYIILQQYYGLFYIFYNYRIRII